MHSVSLLCEMEKSRSSYKADCFWNPKPIRIGMWWFSLLFTSFQAVENRRFFFFFRTDDLRKNWVYRRGRNRNSIKENTFRRTNAKSKSNHEEKYVCCSHPSAWQVCRQICRKMPPTLQCQNRTKINDKLVFCWRHFPQVIHTENFIATWCNIGGTGASRGGSLVYTCFVVFFFFIQSYQFSFLLWKVCGILNKTPPYVRHVNLYCASLHIFELEFIVHGHWLIAHSRHEQIQIQFNFSK